MLPKISDKNEKYILGNYGKSLLTDIMIDTGLTEHQVRSVARKAGLIKKRRPLVDFNDQMIQIPVPVQRRYAKQATIDLKKYSEKYRAKKNK